MAFHRRKRKRQGETILCRVRWQGLEGNRGILADHRGCIPVSYTHLKIDFERQPPAFPITETHWAATWLLHPDAPKVEPPKIVTDRIAKMRAKMRGNANA